MPDTKVLDAVKPGSVVLARDIFDHPEDPDSKDDLGEFVVELAKGVGHMDFLVVAVSDFDDFRVEDVEALCDQLRAQGHDIEYRGRK